MAQTLLIDNYGSLNAVELTQLSAAVAAASSSLPVINAADFTTLFLLVGTPGSQIAELLPNSSTLSGISITLGSPTLLPHAQGEAVTALFGNQIHIYRAPNIDGSQPTDAAFTLLVAVDIDADNAATEYTDSAGGGDFWYKYTYYNTANTGETDIGSAVAVRGTFTVDYCSLDDIRREAGFKYAPYVGDDQIAEKRAAAQDEINGALDEFYQTPLQPPINDYLKQICIRLAAGLLRKAQYSQISQSNVNGQDMVDDAELELDKLVLKQRVLVNKQGQALDGPGAAGGISGWPNSSTAQTPGSQGGAPRVFRMSDIQGKTGGTDSNGNPSGNSYYGRKW